MVLEMLFSVALTILSVYCIFYVNSTILANNFTDPLGAAFWPRTLLILLIVLSVINIIQIYKRTSPEKRNWDSITKINFKAVLHNRLTLGIILMVVYAGLLPVTGFLLTSFLMSIGLSFFLGERRPVVLIIFSFLLTALVFIIFFKGMGIQMPRGTVPFLREFALSVESFIRHIGK